MPQPREATRRATRAPTTRRIAVLAYPGAQTLDVTGPLEVFAAASRLEAMERQERSAGVPRAGARSPAYEIEVLAPEAGPVAMRSGLRVVADRAYDATSPPIDTLLVAGGDEAALRGLIDTPLLRWLRGTAPKVRRLGSVCSGAFVLAEAGLLNGRRVTTHWGAAERLARDYPAIQVDPDAIYVRDDPIYTSAGVTAGMDLALALVEDDLGRRLALATARQLVLFLKRPGGQSQFSTHLAAQTRATGPLAELAEWIADHLDDDLSVAALAARAAMSPRNFARVFARQFGVTPAKFVEQARVERARVLLEENDQTLDQVACDAGFGTAERMRRTFARHLRVVPDQYRQRFEVNDAGPAASGAERASALRQRARRAGVRPS